jgi:hypothetical protein
MANNLCINLYLSISYGKDFGKPYGYINWPLNGLCPETSQMVTGSVGPTK